MPRRTHLPTEHDVRVAVNEMHQAADTTGGRPTPAGVARHLGLANTTFRRRFPHIVAELAAPTAENRPASSRPARTSYDQLNDDNAQLREHKRELTEHLQFAVAQLQRLTLDNHQLREQLETQRGITRLPRGAGNATTK